MRKAVIWILIVAIVLGFVYVGNNLFAANLYPANLINFLPQSDAVVQFNNHANVSSFFKSLSRPFYDIGSYNNGYLLLKNNEPVLYESERSSEASIFDLSIKELRDQGFDTKTLWIKGFPLISASSVNKSLNLSFWRNYKIVSPSMESIEYALNGILQEGQLLKDNPDFTLLWRENKNSDISGVIFPQGKEVLDSNVEIPFLTFDYPLYFSYSKDTLVINSHTNVVPEKMNFSPYDFSFSALSIALPHTSDIKKQLLNSGLSFIVGNKIGVPMNSLTFFASYLPGEFALLNKDDFVFIVKSSPTSNSMYMNELRGQLKNVSEKKMLYSGFPLINFKGNNIDFYVLEFPDEFLVSTNKNLLLKIADKSIPTIEDEDLSELITVDESFNHIIDLYNLNSNKLVLPLHKNECIVKTFINKGEKEIVIGLQ